MTEPTERRSPRAHVAFDDAESACVYQFAEWFAARCREHNMKPPPDPLRALLVRGVHAAPPAVAFLERILAENDIDVSDYAPILDPETMQ